MFHFHCLVLLPPGQFLDELLQAVERAAVEETQFRKPKWPLSFALEARRTPGRHDQGEVVVRGEVDEMDVGNRPAGLPAVNHPGHRVGHALAGHSTEAFEAALEAIQDGGLPGIVVGEERARPGPRERVAPELDLLGCLDFVGRPVELALLSYRRPYDDEGLLSGFAPFLAQLFEILADHRVLAVEAQSLQSLEQTLGRQVRELVEPGRDLVRVAIDL
jgi:hypothetical protein